MNFRYNKLEGALGVSWLWGEKTGRARGDNWERSDVDLAISGGNRTMFSLDVDEIENVPTLLMFDVVDLDSECNKDLLASIRRDGVVLYEV